MPLVNYTTSDGYRRQLGVAYSPDWFEHWGSLTLFLALHGGNMSVERFMKETRITDLIGGQLWSPTRPQKLVAIFPQGLGINDDIGGGWNSGHMGMEGASMQVDDVMAILEGIAFVNDMLGRRLQELKSTIPIGTFYDNAKRIVAGFSNGGNMAARLVAEAPAAPVGLAVEFDCLGLISSTASGYALSDGGKNSLRFEWPPPPTRAPDVLVIHGGQDRDILYLGGLGSNSTRVDDLMGGFLGAGEGYYRYDDPVGPDTTRPVGTTGDATGTELTPYIDATGRGTWDSEPSTAFPHRLGGLEWLWDGPLARVKLIFDPDLGHVYPYDGVEDIGRQREPYSATKLLWDFCPWRPIDVVDQVANPPGQLGGLGGLGGLP